MGDYYTLITRAVSALPNNTTDARQALYERARVALTSSLLRHDPPMSEADFERERSALEAGIMRVEREASIAQTQTADAAKTEPTQTQPAAETTGSTGPAAVLSAALPQMREDQAHPTVSALESGITGVEQEPSIGQMQMADAAKTESAQSQPADETTESTAPALPQIREDQSHPTDPTVFALQTQIADTAKIEPTEAHPTSPEKIASNGPADTSLATSRSIRDTTLPRIRPIKRTFVYVNRVLLSVTCLLSVALAIVIFVGPSWIPHIFDCLFVAACSAVILCALGILPIAQAKVSKVELLCTFLVSSYLLGMTTWLLGVLITLQYWGTIGLVIGLCLGIVGVVPLGIVAATMNADWSMVAMMIIGVLVTYGARALALERIDRENSPAISA